MRRPFYYALGVDCDVDNDVFVCGVGSIVGIDSALLFGIV